MKVALVTLKKDADGGGTDLLHDTEATLMDNAPAHVPASDLVSSLPGACVCVLVCPQQSWGSVAGEHGCLNGCEREGGAGSGDRLAVHGAFSCKVEDPV